MKMTIDTVLVTDESAQDECDVVYERHVFHYSGVI